MNLKRIIAMMLATMMIIGVLPVSALAEVVAESGFKTAYAGIVKPTDPGQEDPEFGAPGEYEEGGTVDPTDPDAPEATPDPGASEDPEEEFEIYNVTVYYYFDGKLNNTKQQSVKVTAEQAAAGGVTVTFPAGSYSGYDAYECTEDLTPKGGKLSELSVTVKDANVEKYITFVAQDTEYFVKHVFGDKSYTEKKTCKVGELTDATAIVGTRVIEGVTVDATGWQAGLVVNYPATVITDPVTITINYSSAHYIISFDVAGGESVNAVELDSAQDYTVSQTTEKLGYSFDGWMLNGTKLAGNVVTKDMLVASGGQLTLTASWKGVQVNYTVNYWAENADDDGYSFAGTETKQAVVGSQVTVTSAQAPTSKLTGLDSADRAHFTYKSAETVTVEADGSTIVNVYFSRNVYTLTFGAGKHTHQYDGSYQSGFGWGKKTYYVGGCYPEGDVGKKTGGAQKGGEICGIKEGTVMPATTVSGKYNSKIENFPDAGQYGGVSWKDTSGHYSYNLQTLDRIPGYNVTFQVDGSTSGRTEKTIHYYVQTVDSKARNENVSFGSPASSYQLLKDVKTWFNYMTYNEEYHEIQGFTRFSASAAGFSNNQKGSSRDKDWYLYYMRNNYALQFSNAGTIAKSETVPFESGLSAYASYVPATPAAYSEGYRFDGWYKDEAGSQKFDFNTEKMPAGDVMVYAKWVKDDYQVTVHPTFLAAEGIDSGVYTITNDSYKVYFGDKVDLNRIGLPMNPPKEGYEFRGWYTNSACTVPFTANTVVRSDLNIYAKWVYTGLVGFTIRYIDKATGASLTPDITGSDEIGKNLSASAKGFTGYQLQGENYRKIVLSANPAENVITFEYAKIVDGYAVVEYKHNGQVIGSVAVQNKGAASITVKLEPPVGYVVDSGATTKVVTEFGPADNPIRVSIPVSPIKVTVTVNGYNGEYDGRYHSASVSTTSFPGYTVIASVSKDAKIKDAGKIENIEPENVRVYYKGQDVTDRLPDGTITITKGTLEVTPREITVKAPTDTKKYDGTYLKAQQFEITGGRMVAGEGIKVWVKGQQLHAGESASTITKIEALNENTKLTNYEFVKQNGTLTVTQREVTITSADAEKPFDGKELTKHEYTVSGDGFVGSDESGMSLSWTGTQTQPGSSENSFTVRQSELNAKDYKITTAFGTLTVTEMTLPVVVTIVGNTSTVDYNGTKQEVTGYTVTGITVGGVASDLYKESDFALAKGVEAKATGTDAGTYGMGLSSASFVNNRKDVKNVTFAVTDGSLVINKIGMTINAVAENVSGTYDGTTNWTAKNVTFTSDSAFFNAKNAKIVNDKSLSSVNVLPKTALGYTAADFSYADTTNFNVTFNVTDGSLEVKKASNLTVSGTDYEGTYDAAAHGVAATASVTEGTTVYYSVDGGAWTTDVPQITNVGTMNVSVKAENDNYDTATASYTLKVTPKDVTVTADNMTKSYGQAIPALTATVTGTLGEDTVRYTIVREPGEDVGEYAITVSGDEYQGNYKVTYAPGKLTIVASDALTIRASGYEGIYDTAVHGTAATVNYTEGTTVSYSTDGGNTWSATFPQIKDVGEINVTVKAENANYVTATATYTLKVTPKTVTVQARNASKYYGDGDPELTASVTGTFYGDSSKIAYSIGREQGEDAGVYAITPSGEALQGNYKVEYVNGEFTIKKVALTILVDGESVTEYYDGNPHTASEVTFRATEGAKFFDETKISYTKKTATATNAGEGVQSAGYEPADFGYVDENLNIRFIIEKDATVKIKPLQFEVTINGDKVEKEYDGTTHTVNTFTATGKLFDDDAPAASASFFDASKVKLKAEVAEVRKAESIDVCTEKAIGFTSGDFYYDDPNGNISIWSYDVKDGWLTVKPVTVTVTPADNSKVYGTSDPDPLTTVTATGLLDADQDLLEGQLTFTRTAGENVGDWYTITVNGPATLKNGNYNVVYETAKFSITQATGLTIVAGESIETVFTGDTYRTRATATPAEGTVIYYSFNEGDGWSEYVNVPEGWRCDAGTTRIKAKAVNSNYADSGVESEEFYIKVNPRPITVTIEAANDTVTYDGTEKSIEGWQVTKLEDKGDKPLAGPAYAVDASDVFLKEGLKAEAKGTNAGFYRMGLTSDSFDFSLRGGDIKKSNYAMTYEVTDGWLQIEKKSAYLKTAFANEYYSGKEYSPWIIIQDSLGINTWTDAQIAERNVLIEYKEPNGEWTMTKPAWTEAGVYKWDVRATAPNYVFEIELGMDARIYPRPMKVEIQSAEFWYGEGFNNFFDMANVWYRDDWDKNWVEYHHGVFVDRFLVDQNRVAKDLGSAPYAAGEYTIDFEDTPYVGPNFEIREVVVGKLTIKPRPITVTVTGNTDSKVYTGSEQSVTGYEAPWAEDITGLKLVDGSAYPADHALKSGIEAVAKRTEIGTTNMGLTSDSFDWGDHNNFTVKFEVTDGKLTIDPAKVTVTAENKTKVFGTTDPKLTAKISGLVNDEPEYFIKYSLARAAGENVGDYTITASGAKAQGNYEVSYVNANFEITPVTDEVVVTIKGDKKNYTYDATEKTAQGYTAEISDDRYTESDFTFSGTAEVTETDAGTYAMGLAAGQFANASSNFTNVRFDVTDGELKIAEREITVEIIGHTASKVYNGSEQFIVAFDLATEDELYDLENDYTFSGTARAAGTDVGTYYMGLDAAQFTNNNTNFKVTFVVTEGWLKITPVTDKVTVTIAGHNDTKTYDGTEHSVSGYDFASSNTLYTEALIAFSGTAEAKRTDAGTANMGLAKEQFSNTSANFTDVAFVVTDGVLTVDPLAVKVTVTGNTAAPDFNGAVQTVDGIASMVADSTLYDVKDVAFDATKAHAEGTNVGEYPMGLKTDDFTNGNANFTVTFELTDGKLTINELAVEVEITGNKANVWYNGEDQNVTGYTAKANSDLYDCDADIAFTGTALAEGKYDGTYDMQLANEMDKFANTNGNFTVTFKLAEDGQLIVQGYDVTVRVNYIYDESDPVMPGTEAAGPQYVTYTWGKQDQEPYAFDWTSPDIEGFSADMTLVAGNLNDLKGQFSPDAPEVIYTVRYLRNTHTLTINYWLGAVGGERYGTYVNEYRYLDEYSVLSPAVRGWTAGTARVSGTMGDEDIEVDVVYTHNPYTLTVRYLFTDGTEAAPEAQRTHYADERYSVDSPTITGYESSRQRVAGVMPDRSLTVTVIYSRIEEPIIITDDDVPLGIGAAVMVGMGDCIE
ncbi:MAG: MBG domain-containing protein [Clostridia bacterium]|nr:MBG domain-containing protein [Clostridia bacterium]